MIYGNLERIQKEDPGVPEREWAETYGGVVRFRTLLGVSSV